MWGKLFCFVENEENCLRDPPRAEWKICKAMLWIATEDYLLAMKPVARAFLSCK